MNEANSISLFSWNINGLRAVLKKGALEDFVITKQPDVVLLQETKISEQQIIECGVRESFAEYEQFYTSAKKPGYAGTGIWIKKSVSNAKKVEIDFDDDGLVDDYGDLLAEGRITAIELAEFYVVSVYVPNSKDDLSRLKIREEWDRYLAKLIDKLQKNKPVVIAGDFNVAHEPIDLARPKENVGKHGFTEEERKGFSALLVDTKLVDTFRELHPDEQKYSWWSHWGNARANNVGWRIDYVLASKSLKNKVLTADISPEILGSDHCPVEIKMEI